MKKSMVKSERGFTLVELLATIVILGIIAAIAVPSIGKLLENTKQDAHKANAQQIIEAARLYVLSENSSATSISASDLSQAGYLESVPKDPSANDSSYSGTETIVTITTVNNKHTYSVDLVASDDSTKRYTYPEN
ncbi:type II secretion system protein [Pseudalkalibacillus sp. R45]|uniref:type II secretion system protein n=1 Tax=Pseudalkalibacillus sp. R45 TaxID=3457433 RepID=UPI003FCC3C9E